MDSQDRFHPKRFKVLLPNGFTRSFHPDRFKVLIPNGLTRSCSMIFQSASHANAIALIIDAAITNSGFHESEKSATFIKINELSFPIIVKDDSGVKRSDKCRFNVKPKDSLIIISSFLFLY